VELSQVNPMTTVLDWLREQRGLTGTKEGCNEGDCGACTVMVTDARGVRALNACILFLPQIDGMALRTVEGIAEPGGDMHPVQVAMVENHGSQCGFCTPGFVVSMAVAHAEGAQDFDDRLAGNLCRCTGYKPIVAAAKAAQSTAVPDHISTDLGAIAKLDHGSVKADEFYKARSLDDFAAWYVENPNATLIAGATDVGLRVTKQFADLRPVAFLGGIPDLKIVDETEAGTWVGAMVTIADFRTIIQKVHPSFGELLRRYGSQQVRSAATLGGNIANGSPIGDSPPALMALGAQLHLHKGSERRTLALEDFFIEYGKQDLAEGEFVEAVFIPSQQDRLKCYKLSKRFDQDISGVCGCFNIQIMDGQVTDAKIAFGGMAGIPKRASHVEAGLIGKAWSVETIGSTWDAWQADFTPLSDMRASSGYRLETARNMLTRYFAEDNGVATDVLQVRA